MSIVCFGEMLWDVLPGGRQPGGAPLNVAVHLRQLGCSADLISCVGEDEPGTELLRFIQSRGLDTTFIQRSKHYATGRVTAHVDAAQEVTYQIDQPVAWDYIRPGAAPEQRADQAEALVFGSLAARQPDSRQTLRLLLERARLKVFDVNLRPPHYTRAVVTELLAQANLLKLNHHELAEIMAWFGKEPELPAAMQWLTENFGLQAVCVTCGAAGALLWTGNHLYRAPGVPVAVKDPIGSGDAFLAALLKGWLAGTHPEQALRLACATGALVATHPGATPAFTEHDVQALMARQAV
ncbi:carbohydrate kinase [Hymenobacter sp. DG01]|uniref:carbohydrate kinase family protein n=1 Tax=Hymenobacter sp. DG01 TaxID=2584940 RepID=UPI002150E192|nr:carbohydrate kinase [Hymenobacter sp. DG01]